ncbi:hypothetical protein CC80DRAFT_467828 [Byssothecium circinans]|uniref:PhnB-like domain-containing protein n=1 Tax=Byssothecium circinans TaxID=147558 RepID=A0A6A5UDZ3_9PLEO|nr:hypothetical protein CC80DRAFT_467828 [Byssothecium circinans]
MSLSKIQTCLWFKNDDAEEAAKFYVSVFPNSSITHIQPYNSAGTDIHKHEAGAVMTVQFDLNGHTFVGLNGGEDFTFNHSISFQIMCDDQAEVDHYWESLTKDPNAKIVECGWLVDKWGVSWQVVPKKLIEYLKDGSEAQQVAVTNAMFRMKKLDIAAFAKAYDDAK